MTRSACRWKSERQAKKAVVSAKCDIVVDVRIEAAGDGGDQMQELDLKRCHWVAKACQRSGMTYLYTSSSRVFSGQLDRPYTEEDFPDNETRLVSCWPARSNWYAIAVSSILFCAWGRSSPTRVPT